MSLLKLKRLHLFDQNSILPIVHSQEVIFTIRSCFSKTKNQLQNNNLKIFTTEHFLNILADIIPTKHYLTSN